MKKLIFFLIILKISIPQFLIAQDWFQKEAEKTLQNASEAFHSISTNGGYAGLYSPDLEERYGEATYEEAAATEIWVQPPGTPSVGASYLRAYRITGDYQFLSFAIDAARALAWGQRKSGGWDHRVDVAHLDKNAESVTKTEGNATFDDNITQGALTFLMDMDTVIERPWLTESIELGLDYMLESQFKNGGWPQWYPLRGGYHDYFTFNDNSINDCIRVMLKAYQQYGDPEYLWSARKGGNFIIRSQVANPQAGWAQQYNHDLEPAWARSFEPKGVCSAATARNIRTLVDLYLFTGDKSYLQPIPMAIAWLERSEIENDYWARLYEEGTNKPIYGDRTIGDTVIYEYENVSERERTSYGWQGSYGIPETIAHYKKVKNDELTKPQNNAKKLSPATYNKRLEELRPQAREVIDALNDNHLWIEENMIQSGVFVNNVNVLCDYLEMLNGNGVGGNSE